MACLDVLLPFKMYSLCWLNGHLASIKYFSPISVSYPPSKCSHPQFPLLSQSHCICAFCRCFISGKRISADGWHGVDAGGERSVEKWHELHRHCPLVWTWQVRDCVGKGKGHLLLPLAVATNITQWKPHRLIHSDWDHHQNCFFFFSFLLRTGLT